MPIYHYACSCGRTEDAYRMIADRDNAPACCGTMKRVIVAPMVADDIQPYQSMIDGTWITSKSQHRTHLRDHGMVEIGNEVQHFNKPRPVTPPGIKEELIRVAYEKLRY